MSKHKTSEQRKEEKIKELKTKLSKEKATYARLTMQLEIAKQLNAALDEQHNILLRLHAFVSRGEENSPEYLQLEQRNEFLENFINEHKYLKDNLKKHFQ